MFFEIASHYHNDLHAFHPFAPATDRKAYDSIDEHLKKELIHFGEEYLNYDYPYLPMTSYMVFCRTGSRAGYQDIARNKRRVLNTLVLAECVEYKGRFLDDIINGIFSICEESAWQLPAHNRYGQNSEIYPIPDVSRPVLDLYACETAAQLAIVYYLLKDSLDNISPCICKRIETELNSRIFVPYLTQHFWWMGQDDEPMDNWTIWCTQNILIAAFSTMLLDSDKLKQIFFKACQSIDYFLKDYGEDGCCSEGAQYYRFSGLCLFNALEVLNAITDNAFIPIYQDPKIYNIAHYIYHVHVSGRYYINFSDCSPLPGFSGVREFLFGKRLNSPKLMAFAALEHSQNPDHLLKSEFNLFHRLQAAFTETEINNYPGYEDSPKQDIYYKSVGVFLSSDDTLFLAAKAGYNADGQHNHNDTGSFTLYSHGLPMIIDVGVGLYTKDTFSEKRYEIWTMQSSYHNLPTFGQYMQKDGYEYQATNVQTFFEPDICGISMELAHCYPPETGINTYLRKFTFVKGHYILIEDQFSPLVDNSFMSLMACEFPDIQGNLISIGNLGTIEISGNADTVVESISITDPKLKEIWGDILYRIKIYLEKSPFSLKICASKSSI